MLKLVSVLFTILLFTACGVETSSSDLEKSENTGTGGDSSSSDTNDSGNTDVSNDSGDSGSTDDSNSTSDGNVTIKSIFDTADAVEDKYACIVGDSNNGFTSNAISDDSFDYADTSDEEDGVAINSRFPITKDLEQATVNLFYYDLQVSRWMSSVSIYEDDFRLSVDRAWSNNDDTIIYARTPKNSDGLYSCYRYDLNNIDVNTTVKSVKVFRREIE